MKTTYLVWKNPSCSGVNPEWQEMTGKEFLALVRSPEGKGRHFVNLSSVESDYGDGAIVMETTKTEYVKWRKEKDHGDYVREQQKKSGYRVVSYHAMEIENQVSGEELLEDTGVNVEADFLKSADRELLNKALSQLTEDEYRMVEYFYLSEKSGTERGYSAITGIPKVTVHNRKTAVVKKIKNFFQGDMEQIKN